MACDTIKLMNQIEKLILFILDRAKKMGINDLSRFQLFKISYLIQVESIKYTGAPFISGLGFTRDENGPISTDIYTGVDSLVREGYIHIETSKTEGYEYRRCGHSLSKEIPDLGFSTGETVFLDGLLSEILCLSQRKLKAYAYNTEPMIDITSREGGSVIKGVSIDFSKVLVDPDIVDTYADAI